MKASETLRAEVTSCGYMLYYRDRPIGGVGTAGTATHTSRGKRRAWQSVRKDLAEYRAGADRAIACLRAGAGEARYMKVITEIDAALELVNHG